MAAPPQPECSHGSASPGRNHRTGAPRYHHFARAARGRDATSVGIHLGAGTGVRTRGSAEAGGGVAAADYDRRRQSTTEYGSLGQRPVGVDPAGLLNSTRMRSHCLTLSHSVALCRFLFHHKRTGEPADASSPVCSEERKNYFFFAAFLAGFLATFFFAAFFLAAIVQLLSRRVFPWRFPGESLGFSAALPRRKFLHGPEGRVGIRFVSPSKTARARLLNRSTSQSSHVELAYTIV